MPKQRNHQHHRQRGAPRTGLQLPTNTFAPFAGMPTVRYPKGWVTRAPNFAPLFRLYAVIAGGIILLALLAILFITLFGSH